MSRKLRIAVFTYEFPALSETFVLNQITGLLDQGHDVTIFAEGPRDEPVIHPDVGAYGLADRTRYLALPGNRFRRCGTALRLATRLLVRNPRALATALNVRRYGRLALSLRLLYWADRLRGDTRFDIIHAHFGPLGQLAACLRQAGLISGRLVTVLHGADMTTYLRDPAIKYDHLFKVGDLFLPIAEVWKRRLLELGCDADRVRVHHMGVDTKSIPFRARHLPRRRPLIALSVGRLVEKKGIADALHAVADLVRRGIDIRYFIAGDGPLRGQLTFLAKRLGVADVVSFVGWRDHDGIVQLMNEADILLAPSVTASDGDQEGIPVTLMEAMAAGMLVVSTDHSGIPELVENGHSGLLVNEGDFAELAAAVFFLLSMEEAWPRVSQAARQKVEEDFDVRTLNGNLAHQFEALLPGGARTAARAESQGTPTMAGD